MADLLIGPPLADELRELAENEHQTVEEILKLLISQYKFLTTEDEADAELNTILRERYTRMRGGNESDEVVISDDQTVAKLRTSAAMFRKLLNQDST
jgi:hypothetical protein